MRLTIAPVLLFLPEHMIAATFTPLAGPPAADDAAPRLGPAQLRLALRRHRQVRELVHDSDPHKSVSNVIRRQENKYGPSRNESTAASVQTADAPEKRTPPPSRAPPSPCATPRPGFAQLSHSAQKLSDLHKKSIRAWLPPLIVDSVSFGFRAHSIENKILFFNG